MAEELYFFKLDSNKARTKLLQTITSIKGFSYQTYLSLSSSVVDYNKVISAIQKDIGILSKDELWSLYFWFNKKNEQLNPKLNYSKLNEIIHAEMNDCGLELFYEIESKTPVRKFHEIMGSYEGLTEQTIDFKCTAIQFRGFLNYLICYTAELTFFLDRHYYKRTEKDQMSYIMSEWIYTINENCGDSYHQLALEQIEEQAAFNLETINLTKQLKQFRKKLAKQGAIKYPQELIPILGRESDLINKASIFYLATQLKEKLANYSGVVARLHSY